MPAALELVDRSLEANALNPRALNLKAAVLRHLGRPGRKPLEAVNLVIEARAIRSTCGRWPSDGWPARIRRRRSCLSPGPCCAHPATALETAAEYQDAGLWEDGLAVLSLLVNEAPDRSRISPLVYYDLAFFAARLGQQEKADAYR